MKNPFSGFICTCLLVLAGNVSGHAQEKRPEPQAPVQAAVATSPDSPATPAADPSQVAQPAPAGQDPVQQQAPPPPGQTPPVSQTPPVGQTPPVSEDQPVQRGRIPEPPPPPPKIPDVRRPGESGFWIGVEGWFPKEQPTFDRGNQSTFIGSSRIKMQGSPSVAENAEIGAAVGLHNTLKLNYTDFRAAGNYTTPVDVVAWAQTYAAGTYISTNYHVQAVKLSYEYLTWPYPVGSRKFRLKTLWQVQTTVVNSLFDSPKGYFDSNGNRLIDPATGNPINLAAGRSRYIFSPMFGLGAYYYPSRHFRLELNGSGFGLPHKYNLWDADASVNVRVAGHFEIRLGARAFSFKTSTNSDYFLKGTFASAFFGLRWYSNSE